MDIIIIAIFTPFIFSFFSYPLAKWAGYRFDLIDYPSIRRIHIAPTLKIGGMIILTGYILGVLILKTIVAGWSMLYLYYRYPWR